MRSGNATLEFTGWFVDNIHGRMLPEDLAAERRWDEVAAKNGPDRAHALFESQNALTPGYFFDRVKALAFAKETKESTFHTDAMTPLMADLVRHYDLRDALRRFDRPVLIVQGHQDPMGQKTAEELHALMKGSTLIYIDRAGHFSWIEQPDAFGKAIDAFLK